MNRNFKYLLILAAFALEALLLSDAYAVFGYAPVWFWVLAPFAALRAARTVSYNAIGRPIRALWTKEEPDGSGAGDTVNPKGESVIGELLACPICTGTHAAAVLLIVYGHYPPLGLALVGILGVAGLAELGNWAASLLEWQAHQAREETGKLVRSRQAQAQREKLEANAARLLEREIQRDMEQSIYGGRTSWKVEYRTKDGNE